MRGERSSGALSRGDRRGRRIHVRALVARNARIVAGDRCFLACEGSEHRSGKSSVSAIGLVCSVEHKQSMPLLCHTCKVFFTSCSRSGLHVAGGASRHTGVTLAKGPEVPPASMQVHTSEVPRHRAHVCTSPVSFRPRERPASRFRQQGSHNRFPWIPLGSGLVHAGHSPALLPVPGPTLTGSASATSRSIMRPRDRPAALERLSSFRKVSPDTVHVRKGRFPSAIARATCPRGVRGAFMPRHAYPRRVP